MVIFYDNRLRVSLLSPISKIFDSFEFLATHVEFDKTLSFTIGSVYKPPSTCIKLFTESFKTNVLDNLDTGKLIICGDFNVDLLADLTSDRINFISSLLEKNLLPTINVPTRITPFSATLLDHIWTNIDEIHSSFTIDYPITDHSFICTIFKVSKTSDNQLISYRTFLNNKISQFIESFKFMCNHITWLNIVNPEEYLDYFTHYTAKMIEIYFPIKNKKLTIKSLKSPWISNELLNLVHKKHYIFKLCKRGFLPYSRFKAYRNLLNKAMELTKRIFYKN